MNLDEGLHIGPGFQTWIGEHEATPLSNEMYFNAEMSTMLVRVSLAGVDTHVLLMYNKLTNEIVPFVEASL